MYKKFEVNQTKIKGGCQSERNAAEMISYSKMPLHINEIEQIIDDANAGTWNQDHFQDTLGA